MKRCSISRKNGVLRDRFEKKPETVTRIMGKNSLWNYNNILFDSKLLPKVYVLKEKENKFTNPLANGLVSRVCANGPGDLVWFGFIV